MEKAKTSDIAELVTQMKMTNCLLAAQLKDRFKQIDLVGLLAGTDASNKLIANVLSTTEGTVRMTRKRLSKGRK
jgi:hypothetical protein